MSMVDFLLSPPAQRILRLVYGQPEQAFMLTELLASARTGRGNGQRQVELLLRAGVLKEAERRGRCRALQANTDCPIYPELHSIYRKSFGVTEPIQEALLPFRADIKEAFVFGSVATGKDTHRSDVDLMIVGDLPLIDVSGALGAAEEVIGRPIHLNLYTASEWEQLRDSDYIVKRIATGATIVLFPND